MDEQTSTRQLPVSDDDIRALVSLIGHVAGMTELLNQRRRTLLDGLCRLIDGDVWLWNHVQRLPDGSLLPLNLLDAGWRDDAERNRLFAINSRVDVGQSVMAAHLGTDHTTAIYDSTHPGWGDGSIWRDHMAPLGWGAVMISMYHLPEQVFSGIGIHRRAGKPPYTPREQAIMHLVLGQIDWLHRIATPEVVHTPLSHLPNRERELLFHLLNGDSRKQAARRMGLSTHTVSDYVKTLYKRLDVNSRGELMSKFLPAQAT